MQKRHFIRAAAALAGHPGVEAAGLLMSQPIELEGKPTQLNGADLALVRSRSDLPWVQAPQDDAVFDPARGGAVLNGPAKRVPWRFDVVEERKWLLHEDASCSRQGNRQMLEVERGRARDDDAVVADLDFLDFGYASGLAGLGGAGHRGRHRAPPEAGLTLRF